MKIVRLIADRLNTISLSIAVSFLSAPAFAASTSGGGLMPWDSKFTMVESELTGPWAHVGIVAAIVGSGIAFMHAEQGGVFKKGAGVVCAGSGVVGAVSLAGTLTGAVF